MKLLRLLLLACVPIALLAQSPTQLTPLASGGQVNAAAYSDSAHGSMFPSLDATLKRVGVVIANNTDEAVIASLVRWDWVDSTGKKGSLVEQKDTIGVSMPIAGPHSTWLVLPSHAPMAPGGRLVATFKMPAGFLDAPTVSAKVDTLILADGQVIGPDDAHLVAELQARTQAADTIRQILTAAKARERDPLPDIKQAIANAPPGSALARQLVKLSAGGRSLQMPHNYPLPSFYRK